MTTSLHALEKFWTVEVDIFTFTVKPSVIALPTNQGCTWQHCKVAYAITPSLTVGT